MHEFFNTAKYFNDKPMITMLHGADTANEYKDMTDAQLVNITDNLFRSLWTGTSNAIIKLYLITHWKADEHARGSYSYLPPGATVSIRTDLCKYLGDGIYWAGEHCSTDWPATVNGALDSGLSASRAIISATPKPTSKPSTTRPTRSPSSRPTSRKPTSKPSTKKPTSIIV
jgi:monoamine oxidase